MSQDDPPTEAEETVPDEPTFADRIEASDDFRAALEQSTGLVMQHRRILLVLVLLGILAAGTIAYPYLL